MDIISPPQYWTQTCQLPFTHNPTRFLSKNAGLLVSYTNYQTPPLTTFAANLKQHTNSSFNHVTSLDSTSVNPPPPPSSILTPVALTISHQSFLFYCWWRTQCWSKASPLFLNCLLSAGPMMWISCLGKCRSISLIKFLLVWKGMLMKSFTLLYVLVLVMGV